jgi:hypothetical protein
MSADDFTGYAARSQPLGLVTKSLSAVSGPPTSWLRFGHRARARRFGYSDLKEAAVSGAADLWALNRLEVFSVGSGPEFWVCREDQRQVFMAVNELRNVVEARRQAKTRAVKVTAGAGRVWIPRHGVGSRLKVLVHAARSCVHGGDRASSWAGVSRSMMYMEPPQLGHLGRSSVRAGR